MPTSVPDSNWNLLPSECGILYSLYTRLQPYSPAGNLSINDYMDHGTSQWSRDGTKCKVDISRESFDSDVYSRTILRCSGFHRVLVFVTSLGFFNYICWCLELWRDQLRASTINTTATASIVVPFTISVEVWLMQIARTHFLQVYTLLPCFSSSDVCIYYLSVPSRSSRHDRSAWRWRPGLVPPLHRNCQAVLSKDKRHVQVDDWHRLHRRLIGQGRDI